MAFVTGPEVRGLRKGVSKSERGEGWRGVKKDEHSG